MAIESHSAPTSIIDNNLDNRSISELVSILRTSFLVKDFDQVEEVLVSRELKMRKEYQLLHGKFDMLRLDNLARGSLLEPPGFGKGKESDYEIKTLKKLIFQMNEEREKKKRAMEGLEKLLEASKKTQENDRMIIEKLRNKNLESECAMEDRDKTIEELRSKNFKLECSIKELRSRNSALGRTIEAFEKTKVDEWKCIEELKCKNSKLECAKKEAEHNYELCKRKYNELVHRVTQLENTKLVGKKGAGNEKSKNQSGYGAERDDDKITIPPSETKVKESWKKVGAMFTTPPHGRPDNNVLKRHFSPDSDGDVQNRYDLSCLKTKDPEKRYNEKWEAEAEMRAAFDENDLLCMEAVCILYKQSSPLGEPSSALSSTHRGFNEADMLRGSTLALFLSSGDSKGTLNKSVMELNNFDIGGLIDCRSIAIKYLKQLFEIYKNNEDQFLFQ